MDIVFEKSDLVYSLSILQGVSVKNETMPILSNLLIDSSHEKGIEFTGNNLECGVRTKVDGDVNKEGKITVNSKKLLDMVKELPKGEIRITVGKNNRLNISADKGKYTIIGQEADEFPRLPNIESDEKLTVEALSLNMAIQRVSFAAHTDASNNLNCIHFCFLEDRTEVVATRRSVLSLSTIPPLEKSESILNLTIPMQAIREIGRVFSNSDHISTFIEESQLMFTDGTSILTCRLDGSESFPVFHPLIVAGHSVKAKTVTVVKDLFVHSLKRVLVLANPKNNSIKISFSKENIKLSSNGPEIGDAEDTANIMDDGFDGEIALDGHLLQATLGRIPTETVEFRFLDESKPLYVNSASDDVTNLHQCLIMPIRINQ